MATKGQIIQVQGAVVDCEFPPGELPCIFDAVEVPDRTGFPLVLEVQTHLGDRRVRTIAMDTTDGLKRARRLQGEAPLRWRANVGQGFQRPGTSR